MSDQEQGTQITPDAPKRARTSSKRVSHDVIIRAYAAAHPKDDSAKGLRRVLRNNKQADPAYAKHVKNTPWPSHSVATLRKLFKDDAAFQRQLTQERLAKHAKR